MRMIKCDYCGDSMTEPFTSDGITSWDMGWAVIDGKGGKKDACSRCKEKLNAVRKET